MNIYILLQSVIIVFGNLLEKKLLSKNFLYLLGILIIIFVGLRHEIGPDWGGYSLDYTFLQKKKFNEIFDGWHVLLKEDILYVLINFLSINVNFGIHFVNLIIASILIGSFFWWTQNEKNIGIILVLFFSFYLIPIGVGYVRQGLSVAFFLFALNFWKKENKIYIMFLLLAFLSHKFSIIYFYLLLIKPKNEVFDYKNLIFLIFICCLLILFIFFKKVNLGIIELTFIDYFYRYTDLKSVSASLRLGIGVLCSVIFFQFINFFKEREDYRFLLTSAFMNIILFLLHFKFSTICDRIGLYLIPFNLLIISNFIEMQINEIKQFFKISIYLICIFYLIFLTNFSNTSHLLVPYTAIDPLTLKSYNLKIFYERLNLN